MRILVYGSREFALTVSDLVRHCGHEVVGMVDDYNSGAGILGTFDEILQSHPPSKFGIAMAIGYSHIAARWSAWERVCSAGYHAPALIHPNAYVADTAQIGTGTMIMAGAIVDGRAEVDDLVVLWPGVCVNHDVKINRNTFVSPNATLCGFAQVGAHSFIGAGAAVADHCQVPEASFIKMLARFAG